MSDRTVLAAVIAAADRGQPLRPKDLLAFEPAEVRRLFDAGEIHRAELRMGRAIEPVVLASPPAGVDDAEWSDGELQYLDVAYSGGVSFGEMARALKRGGGEILQQAWRMKLDRRATAAGDAAGAHWGSEIPAWRMARLRALLDEAQRRGGNPLDDGDDLQAHRALRRRFTLGRSDAGNQPPSAHNRPWAEPHLSTLRDLRDAGGTIGSIARALGRTPTAVSSKITELRLARDVRWGEDEDLIVITGVERGLLNKQIAAMLPGRSALAVKFRARIVCGRRGAEPWTPEEREGLRQAYARGDNIRTYARDIGRTPSGARWQARMMGLVHPASTAPLEYTDAEDRRIREGWARRDPPKEIAEDLGRPLKGVYLRAFKLGITGHGRGRYHGPRVRRFEIDYIRVRVAQGWTAKEIAARLRRSHHMVYQLAKKNGITFPKRGNHQRAAA